MAVETRITVGKIIHAREASLKKDSTYKGEPRYLSRGLKDRSVLVRDRLSGEAIPSWIMGYDSIFSESLEDDSLSTHIEDRLEEEPQINILDIGCGRGIFLLDCKKKWDERVSTTGISSFPYDRVDYSYTKRNLDVAVPHDPTHETLIAAGVDYILGDAQGVATFYDNGLTNKFDLVVSAYTFQYFADQLAGLKGAYSALKKGGTAFLTTSFLSNIWRADDGEELKRYLMEHYGFKFTSGFVTFQKHRDLLHLPVRYKDFSGNDLYYQLDHQRLEKLMQA